MRLSHNLCQGISIPIYSIFVGNGTGEPMQNSPMHEKDARAAIADWLRTALKDAKISQTELGRRMQLDQSKISKICSEDRGMSAAELYAAANALNVPLPSLGHVSFADPPQNTGEDLQEDLSELALQITKNLEKTHFSGDMPPEDYIEASAVLYAMLKSAGSWHPKLFKTSVEMVDKVKKAKEYEHSTFTDYVKSVALHYRTLVSAENSI